MSQEIALVGVSLVGGGDGATGAGVILGPGALDQFADGDVVSCVGDAIAVHGPPPHDAGVMIEGDLNTFADGKSICRIGDAASCGCAVLSGDIDAFAPEP